MNPIAVFYEGSADIAQRYLPYALHCCAVAEANKRALGTAVTTCDFPLPTGNGYVRVISLEYTNKLIIRALPSVEPVSVVKEEAKEIYLRLRQRLVWLPEGFVITPRSPSTAPDGWGLPNNTPGGPIRNVIINRFEHNLYPDVMYANRKDIADRKLGVEILSNHPFVAEAAFYALEFPKRIPGLDANLVGIITRNDIKSIDELSTDDVFIRQALEEHRLRIDSDFEVETATWFCHRPQLIEYLYSYDNQTAPFAIKSDLLAHIYNLTNQVRMGVGKLMLYPPLRGWYTTLADISIEQNVLHSAISHGFSQFTKGYEYFPSRVSRAGADGDLTHAENLAIVSLPTRLPNESDSQYDKRVAEIVVNGWVASYGHYLNMIYDYVHPSYPNSAAGFLETAYMYGTARYDQQPPYIQDPVLMDSPISGVFASQHFRSRDVFVDFGSAVWYGDAGVVSWNGPSCPVAAFDRLVEATPGGYMPNYQCVFVKGHAIHVAPRKGPHHSELEDNLHVIAAGAFVSRNTSSLNELYIVALLCKKHESESGRVYILTVTPLSGDPITLCTHYVPDSYAIGNASVSPNGRKIILNAPVAVSNAHVPIINSLQVNFSLDHPPPSGLSVVGVDLCFIEFLIDGHDGVFSATADLVHRSSVTINVDVDSNLTYDGEHPWRYNYYKQECNTTYKWQAAYNEYNNLVFAEVEVDVFTEQSSSVQTDADYVSVSELANMGSSLGIPVMNSYNITKYVSKIRFPNGYELTWLDIRGPVATATGYFLCFHYLDILQPTEAVYTRLDVWQPGTNRVVDATFKFGDTTLFSAPYVLDDEGAEYATRLGCRAGADIFGPRPFYLRIRPTLDDYPIWRIILPQGWFSAVHVNIVTEPRNSYKADYVATLYTPTYLYGFTTRPYEVQAPYSSCISPWVATFSANPILQYGIPSYVQVNKLKYKNEHITFIGLVQSRVFSAIHRFATVSERWTPFGYWQNGYPRTPSDKSVFVLSSIDLKAITGVADLDDNIYPLGVI